MKKGLFTLTLLCSIIVAISAQKTFTGTVLDDKKEPIVGAAIVIKGTNMGTLTDENGQYSIKMNDLDTLVLSFVGYKSKEFVPEKNKMDLAMEEGILLDAFVKVGYGSNICRCCGCFCCAVNWDNFYQSIDKQLTAKPLTKGATKLNYSIENSWFGSSKRNISAFKNKYIKYQISKSIDDVTYKIIGTSQSDTTLYVEEKTGKTLVAWGGSQFLDKERNKAELTYYLVEGYLEDFVEKEDEDKREKDENMEYSDIPNTFGTEGPNTKERILVFSKKVTIEGSDYLKINSLFNESNQIELSISSPLNEVANFRIVDMSGRVLTSHQQALLKENNTLTLAHNDLPAGMYILHVQQGEQTDSRKFTITK
jgi:CarboxypepD_reg-like domain/Secretion system C-terminal sorting domain